MSNHIPRRLVVVELLRFDRCKLDRRNRGIYFSDRSVGRNSVKRPIKAKQISTRLTEANRFQDMATVHSVFGVEYRFKNARAPDIGVGSAECYAIAEIVITAPSKTGWCTR